MIFVEILLTAVFYGVVAGVAAYFGGRWGVRRQWREIIREEWPTYDESR